jgi:hypothetical protein
MTYNVWNKWDKLETVMIGSCHPLEFYDGIKEDKIRDPLLRITEETLQELDYFKSVLQNFGCEVLQAPTYYDRIDTWQDAYKSALPRSSLQPRDLQLVVGNKCVVSYPDNMGIIDTLKEYNSKDLIMDPQAFAAIIGKPDPKHHMWGAPSATVLGNRIYIDRIEFDEKNIAWFKSKFPDFEYVEVSIGGHNDACFAPIKPGAIISLHDIQQYEKTFPGWDVCYLPDQSWDKITEWETIKAKTQGKWWVPGEETNDQFIHFVNTWLSKWVGYVEETVFDVNCLVLDEHHVCISSDKNETVNAFLKKHNMTPIHIPWRHRFFWDGGLHCITLDLKRQGKKENYF